MGTPPVVTIMDRWGKGIANMRLMTTEESEVARAMADLFATSPTRNIDDAIPGVELRIRELMAHGRLAPQSLLNALHVFLYFNRLGISRVIVRNLERQVKSPTIDILKAFLFGDGNQKHGMLQALYFLKHLDYDTQFQTLKDSAIAAIGNLPLSTYDAVLDGGCGTGLAGPVLRNAGFTGRLIGVDVSHHMVTQAEAKQSYDELVASGIVEYLETHGDPVDVILLIDVVPHLDFETLGHLIRLSHARLRAGGMLLLNAPLVASNSDSLASRHGLHRSGTEQIGDALRETGFIVSWVDEEAMLIRQFCCRRMAPSG